LEVKEIKRRFVRVKTLFSPPDGYEMYYDYLNEKVYLVFKKEIVTDFKVGDKKQAEVIQVIRRHQEKSRGK
jgi:hypothetical protein